MLLHIVWLQARAYQSGKRLVPRLIKQNYLKWLEYNPHLALKTWDLQECIDYIGLHFDERTLAAFRKLNGRQYQTDLFRMLVLYREGGLYVDIDQEPLVSLEEMGIDDSIDFASVPNTRDPPNKTRFCNGFIYVKQAGSAFLKRCIDNALERIAKTAPGSGFAYSRAIGGPQIMGDTYREMFNERKPEKGLSDHCGESWLLLDAVTPIPLEEFGNNLKGFWRSLYVANLQGEPIMNERFDKYYTVKGTSHNLAPFESLLFDQDTCIQAASDAS